MADDRKKRHGSHWDGEKRAAWGRGKTEPGGGIPIEVDPEQTPPPTEPPTAEHFDALPPAAQVRALRNVVAEQSAAIERVWDARHVSERLKRLEVAETENTKQVTRLIVEVKQWADMSKETFDKSLAISNSQVALNTRIGVFFDEQFPTFIESLKGFSGMLGSVSDRTTENAANIEQLAADQREQAAELASLDGRVKVIESKATESLIRSDERRRWFTYITKGRAALVGAGAVIAVLITKGRALLALLGI